MSMHLGSALSSGNTKSTTACTGKWSRFEKEESVPHLMIFRLFVKIRSRRFEVLSVILVGSVMICRKFVASVTSLISWSKVVIPLWLLYFLSRYMFHVLKSPNMNVSMWPLAVVFDDVFAKLSINSCCLSAVKFGAK